MIKLTVLHLSVCITCTAAVCLDDVDYGVCVQCGKKLRFGSKVLKCKGELSELM